MADNPPSPVVGLGTLAALKEAILPGPLAAGTDYDGILASIGRGVAAQFDKATGRTLARVVGQTVEITADRSFVSLPGYPVEEVTGLAVRFYGDAADAWQDYSQDAPYSVDNSAGLVELGYNYGSSLDRLRVVFTGGYWIPGTLNEDGTALAEQPDGATPLPADIFSAWTLQCATEMKARNVLQTLAISTGKEDMAELAKVSTRVTFQPAVEEVLATYRRIA